MSVLPSEGEWRIDRAQEACAACAAKFADGDAIHSGMFAAPRESAEDKGFLRRDYCSACWEPVSSEAFARWRTRCASRVEDHSRQRFLEPEVVVGFLGNLLASTRESDGPLAYVLALYLVRKRRLVLEGTVGEGRDLRLLFRSKSQTSERFEVPEGLWTAETLATAEEALWSLVTGE